MTLIDTPPPSPKASVPKKDAGAHPSAVAQAHAAALERKKKKRKRHNASMKLTRRLHMYFGLVLAPFVLLYGVTAILFNHQSLFSTSTYEELNPALFAEIAFSDPDAIADAVTAEIAEQADVPVERIDAFAADFRGDLIIDFTEDTMRRRYRITPETMSGTLQSTPRSTGEEEEEILAVESVDPRETETIDGIKTLLENEHLDASGRIRSMPDLEFRINADGEELAVTCDLRTGEISQRKVDEPRMDFSLRSFLLRLHVSHGYPSQNSARTVWAVIVDVTAALMIFWAVSGIIMWWQLRPTRFNGMFTMALGVVLAIGLGYAMLKLIYY